MIKTTLKIDGCPNAQRHSLRRADRRERHASDEAHEAYQVGEIAKGGQGATADFICFHAFLSPPQR